MGGETQRQYEASEEGVRGWLGGEKREKRRLDTIMD